jgi:hypothetical protein
MGEGVDSVITGKYETPARDLSKKWPAHGWRFWFKVSGWQQPDR